MKVYLLVEESEVGCCCPVNADEVLGAFASPEAAMASEKAPKPTKSLGWRQGEGGNWYFGRTETRTYRIEEREVQGDGWRRFADELPPEAEEVLFHWGDDVHLGWLEAKGGGRCHLDTDKMTVPGAEMADAYWRPLPEPPKEEG